ncbi:MAG TPA: hypothetical protein VHX88_02790, partial [Solirubrobacteraceae bacterium]|nr:hypothetical protein [Solirubrobacteraceae bacterium]
VGHISDSGVISETMIPGGLGGTDGPQITIDRHGTPWFALPDGIGHLSATGQLTRIAVPEPGAMATGSDGAIWFAEQWRDELGRIDPATGALREFYVPVGLEQLVAGGDGELWSTSSTDYTPSLARISTTGSFQEYPILDPGSLAPGPDAAIWLENLPGALTRVQDSGLEQTLQFPTLPSSSDGIGSLVQAPDGAMWGVVSGPGPDELVRFDPGQPPTSTSTPLDAAAGAPVDLADHRLRDHCRRLPGRSSILASDRQGVVFTAPSPYLSGARIVLGCARSTGRQTRLTGTIGGAISHVHLIGGRVAYLDAREEKDSSVTVFIYTVSLSSGRGALITAASGDGGPGPFSGTVASLVLDQHGDIAWLNVDPLIGSGETLTTYRTHRGEQLVDDASTQGTITDLRLNDGTLYWRHGAQQRSASLATPPPAIGPS